MKNREKSIIFYDKNCWLCNESIRFVRSRDKGKIFLYRTLPSHEKTIVLKHQQKTLNRSDALLAISRQLPGLPRLMGYLGLVIPRPLRDYLYNLVSRNRYKILSLKKRKKDG